MPRDYLQPYALDVAVIGSGISGMAAAWLLSRTHRVTVYEQDGRVGGHSNTVDVPGGDEPIAVDTGFIVFNELNYPNLTALFAHLGVETQASEMSFAASLDDGGLEYSGSSLRSLFGQSRNLFRPRFWRMLRDVRRFYREGPQIADLGDGGTLSLGDYLDREGYSDAFVNDHLLPMAAAIWSADTVRMRAHPALALIKFFMNHGLMRLTGRPQWRTVVGGSRAYVQRMTASFSDRIMINARVTGVTRTPAGVLVKDANGASTRFDQVVIATHADQALAMLNDPDEDERRLLGAFRYSTNAAILHQDMRLMPKRKSVWSSWNYIGGRRAAAHPLSADKDEPAASVCVTYWMNRLQNLATAEPLFVTLNPHKAPAAEKTLQTFCYEHPLFDVAAMRAQGELDRLQGRRDTWFCGSYFGAGFHEDGLTAGLAVGEALGGVRRPWLASAAAIDAASEPVTDAVTQGTRSAA